MEGSPDSPAISYYLSITYYRKGIKDQAISELKKSLSIGEKFQAVENAKKLLTELEAKK